jgi:hypothetical protein
MVAVAAIWWLVRERAERKRSVDLAFAVGLVLAALVPWSTAFLYLLPCVVAAPLILVAHRKPGLAPFALAFALPAYAFFLGPTDARIAPLACALALFPLWGRLSGGLTPSFRALGLVTMTWAVYWTAFGCRVSGFDFTYFYKWLAASSPVEDTWLENALLTTSLYIGLPFLGLLAYDLSRPNKAVEDGLQTLVQAPLWTHVKLGAVLAFLVGYAARGATIGAAVTADLVMESAMWLIAAVVLMMVHAVRPGRGAKTVTPSAVAATAS